MLETTEKGYVMVPRQLIHDIIRECRSETDGPYGTNRRSVRCKQTVCLYLIPVGKKREGYF